MERIIFGDNQFFGINHVSDQKSREQSIQFRKDTSIINMLKLTQEAGINTFMCTTHERMKTICEMIRLDEEFSNFSIYPCLPYAHKYANAVTEYGIAGALKVFMPDNIMSSLFKGGTAVITRNYISMMKLLIDAELSMFKGLNTPVIFLQNVVTDLLLGLGMDEVIVAFDQYIKKKYNAEPGYITMNFPALMKLLTKNSIKNPIVCTSFNNDGFRMPGGKLQYEEAISAYECRVIAMQIFSGGSTYPEKAVEYVCSLSRINSILFGASTAAHIHHTAELIRNLDYKHSIENFSEPLEYIS